MKLWDYGGIKGDSSKSLESTVAAKWLALSRVERCSTEEGGLIGLRLAAGWTKARPGQNMGDCTSSSGFSFNNWVKRCWDENISGMCFINILNLLLLFFSSW